MFALPQHHTPPTLTGDQTLWQLYVGLKGRINRRSFWLHGVLSLLAVSMVLMALLEIAGFHPDRVEKVVSALIAWPSIAISAKRWHDRDRSGWWVLIVLIPIPLIPQLWALIDNGFVSGTRGENRFGAEPTR